uniref:Merozoite surface protein 3 n=1 Tax=Plasmodium cynomolgi TaxID=5827 RepID=X2CLZ7_9APIC|nr:merozoite surface protein 3 [Plasmodium cynomolgi]AGR50669.1 merozoite surface protein 3 [Plasmodium cynomolgi]
MKQFLRIAIFISLLNLCMQKNGAVGDEILNVSRINLRNETSEEGVPSEGEFPTCAEEEKGRNSIEEVIKQTSKETPKFTDEGKKAKSKAAHQFLKTTNQHNPELVEISSQDGDNVNDKNEEVKEEVVEHGGEEEVKYGGEEEVKYGGGEEVKTMEVEDDVDEEEEDEEDDDDGDGDHDDKDENNNDEEDNDKDDKDEEDHDEDDHDEDDHDEDGHDENDRDD